MRKSTRAGLTASILWGPRMHKNRLIVDAFQTRETDAEACRRLVGKISQHLDVCEMHSLRSKSAERTRAPMSASAACHCRSSLLHNRITAMAAGTRYSNLTQRDKRWEQSTRRQRGVTTERWPDWRCESQLTKMGCNHRENRHRSPKYSL